MVELSRHNLLIDNGLETRVGDLIAEAEARFGFLDASPLSVAFVVDRHRSAILASLWLASKRRTGLILGRDRTNEATQAHLLEHGFTLVSGTTGEIVEASPYKPAEPGVYLLTSGSTGTPKLVRHTWETLHTASEVRERRLLRWLVTYQAGTYAWYQLATLLLFGPSAELVVSDEQSAAQILLAGVVAGASAISSTPTFWRIALLQADPTDLRRIALKQISLGGEPVDQAILDTLRALYPSANLTHIFASTETGPAIVVSDARAGFPSSWLEQFGGTRGLRVQDGHLFVRSRWSSPGQPEWVSTGDLVEIQQDRAFVVGRTGRPEINVGGMKVSHFAVETVLQTHPGVAWCRAFPVRAPIVGNLVGVEVALRPDDSGSMPTEEVLTRFCQGQLPEYMVPRFIRAVAGIPVGTNLKTEVVLG